MDISLQTAKDALWWVQDGLDNCDLDRKEHSRTVKCRDELKAFIKYHENEQAIKTDVEKPCFYCDLHQVCLEDNFCSNCGRALRTA